MFASAPHGMSWTHLCVHTEQGGRGWLIWNSLLWLNSGTAGPQSLHVDSHPAPHGEQSAAKVQDFPDLQELGGHLAALLTYHFGQMSQIQGVGQETKSRGWTAGAEE